MKSYLLSALTKQTGVGHDLFLAQHPGDWLVWEPGQWKAPRSQTLVLGNVKDLEPVPPTAKGAEALAIVLADQARVTVGRSPEADVCINDGTLSGLHLALSKTASGRWEVEDLGSTNGTTLEGMPLRTSVRLALRNGSALKAGQVVLTFQTAEGLWTRLVP
jgi:hypothetical protein